MEAQKQNERVAIINLKDYRNAYEDPDPIKPGLTVVAQEAQRKVIAASGEEMYDVLSSRIRTGEELWTDFISTFVPHSMKT